MKLALHPVSFNGGTIPRGTFAYCIGKQGVTSILFWCRGDKNRLCEIALTLGDKVEEPVRRWHWDGNMQEPTITPSIGCDHRCGWHGHITAGDITP